MFNTFPLYHCCGQLTFLLGLTYCPADSLLVFFASENIPSA
uniref:Uncharacterized protein n=1 Tax=Rhizophora mucronata TaxID=61149 RepID=A0A2P2PE28_RHIMU